MAYDLVDRAWQGEHDGKRAEEEWVFELARLPPVGKCVMRSLTVKTLERRTDRVIVPESPDPPVSVIEFQFAENPHIYTRIVQKMAAVQEEFDMREVRGIVFFGEQRLNPQIKPWTHIVRSLVLPDEAGVEKMLIGELPELVETRAGQDLIKIGEERGLAEAAVIVLDAKRGRLTKSLRQRIRKLGSDALRQLLAEAAAWESVDPLDNWLAKHGQ